MNASVCILAGEGAAAKSIEDVWFVGVGLGGGAALHLPD